MTDLNEQARAILRANDRGGYTVPNARVYPFQWNWDSAFVALGFQTFEESRAWDELDWLFKGQWADGLVPHIVFHKPADGYYPGPGVWGTHHVPPTSGITQPPVAASAAWRMLCDAKDKPAAQGGAKVLFPKLMAWHRWWHETRDPGQTGLVTIVHPWETGRDNLPDWDAPLAAVTPTLNVSALRKDIAHVDPSERPTHDFYNRVMTLVEEAKALHWNGPEVAQKLSFRVCDLGIQCILMRADRDLRQMALHLGASAEVTEIDSWITRSGAAFAKLKATDGSFRSLDHRTGALSPAVTSATFLPLYAAVVTPAQAAALAALFETWMTHATFSVPSTDPTYPGFDPKCYWRGPVWLVMNLMIAEGFADYGFDAIAARIRSDSAALIRKSGFSEYFDPNGGEGLGGREFSWTAAIWLYWQLGRIDSPAA